MQISGENLKPWRQLQPPPVVSTRGSYTVHEGLFQAEKQVSGREERPTCGGWRGGGGGAGGRGTGPRTWRQINKLISHRQALQDGFKSSWTSSDTGNEKSQPQITDSESQLSGRGWVKKVQMDRKCAGEEGWMRISHFNDRRRNERS